MRTGGACRTYAARRRTPLREPSATEAPRLGRSLCTPVHAPPRGHRRDEVPSLSIAECHAWLRSESAAQPPGHSSGGPGSGRRPRPLRRTPPPDSALRPSDAPLLLLRRRSHEAKADLKTSKESSPEGCTLSVHSNCECFHEHIEDSWINVLSHQGGTKELERRRGQVREAG